MTEKLWPHQQRVIEAVNDKLKTGIRRILVVVPTGGGKSRIGAALSVFGETVVATHTRELARQSESSFGEGIRVITVQGNDRPDARVVVVDEAHRYAAGVWRRLIEHYSDSVIIGLTATPCRSDGKPLDMFQDIVVGATYTELIEGGFIVPAEVYYPARTRVKGLAMAPVDAYLKFGAGRAGFWYANKATDAEAIADSLRRAGVSAECIGHHINAKHRETIIKAFLERRIDVLTNVNALTEGFNAPWASFVGLAAPCASVQTYLQRAGRGARAWPGKKHYVVVDLCGAYFEHGSPSEDRLYSLHGKPIRGTAPEASLSNCQACGYCFAGGRACPRCGYRAPVKTNPLLVKNIGLRKAVAEKNSDAALEELVKIRGSRSWYWVGIEYKKLFGRWPALGFVPHDLKRQELDRLKADAIRTGRKTGYAYVMYEKIFGAGA